MSFKPSAFALDRPSMEPLLGLFEATSGTPVGVVRVAPPAAELVHRLSSAIEERVFEVLTRLRSVRAGRRAGTAAARRSAQSSALTTLLVTDLEGFTSLVERLGDRRGQQLIHVHNEILRACLKRHRGREVTHTGDGIIAAFHSASAALRCATAMLRSLREHNQRHARTPLRVRIGLHAGLPLPEENRLFGSCVNIASRVCARADGEQILVSEAVLGQIEALEFTFIDRGGVALKGVARAVRLHELHWDPSQRTAQREPDACLN